MSQFHEIKDRYRRNLTKYTLQAFSYIPALNDPTLLDLGCGTGEPSIAIAQNCNCKIYAVDSDKASLDRFEEKTRELGLNEMFRFFQSSALDLPDFQKSFDIVLAEGLLNVIGFEKGLSVLLKEVREDGYLVIHDELKNDREKRKIFEREGLKLLGFFQLGEEIWWKEYFGPIEEMIKNEADKDPFARELSEIESYKKNPSSCRSVYYVLQKRSTRDA